MGVAMGMKMNLGVMMEVIDAPTLIKLTGYRQPAKQLADRPCQLKPAKMPAWSCVCTPTPRPRGRPKPMQRASACLHGLSAQLIKPRNRRALGPGYWG